MTKTFIEIIGYVAAGMTTFSFLPQVLKVTRHKKTDGISIIMYALFCLGITLWLIYGLLNADMPIILANSITLILAAVILFFKIKLG